MGYFLNEKSLWGFTELSNIVKYCLHVSMGALNHLFYWGITPILQLLPLKLSITSVLQMIPFFTIQVWNLRNKDKV